DVKSDRSGSDLSSAFQAKASQAPLPAAKKERSAGEDGVPGNAWSRFWFSPVPTTGLQFLRVASGLLFCAWLLAFLGHQAEFFSLSGFFDTRAYQQVQKQENLAPAPIGWSILYVAQSDQ